jgi:hypothetical protein
MRYAPFLRIVIVMAIGFLVGEGRATRRAGAAR